METDRRCGKEPVPAHLEDVLNEVQLLELRRVEAFGWSLRFIRRPLFQDVIPVVHSPDTGSYAILDIDGIINRKPDIRFRA